ncbi:hypothetical protein [Pseudanabaena sp. UWO310]|uniref:hypothetical protein n=1 Tax=Pseudanabaena sp. UWO310 TaxID=2480795 RepID=UPI001156CBA3|nr:hypothetical protein [Pseudanabaena sp. UWO310]TYQ30074.1 hypothetical protein PseudUWO310_10435 [Pseudanabaena sp. UWO310]
MKLRILTLFFISVFATFFAAISFAENTEQSPSPKPAQSLNQVSRLFENKNGLTNFHEELDGIPEVDKLGMKLPSGLNAKDLIRLLAPNQNPNLAIVVGAKAFPYRSNSYVVITCFARTQNEYEGRISSFDRNSCEKENRDRDDVVYVGLIEYDPVESKPKLIAKSLEIRVGWLFIITEQFRSDSLEKKFLLPKGRYKEFDLAPYRVSDTQTAFGIRIGTNDGYAGGFGYFEVLTLFMIDNNQIVNILSEPIYFYQNIAGSWNKDGTRQHSLYEGENVIVVLPKKTDGYYDLQIKALDNDWQKTFSWDASLKRYLPSDRTAILNRVLAETLNLRVD